jgi:hypothetical protein
LAELGGEEAGFWEKPPEGTQPVGALDSFSKILRRKNGDEEP